MNAAAQRMDQKSHSSRLGAMFPSLDRDSCPACGAPVRIAAALAIPAFDAAEQRSHYADQEAWATRKMYGCLCTFHHALQRHFQRFGQPGQLRFILSGHHQHHAHIRRHQNHPIGWLDRNAIQQ